MALMRNIALMGTSTVIRLGFGMLTFVLMARVLGPESFGTLMFWLSVATLLSLLANFGFTPYLLREIGAAPAQAQRVMSEVFAAKLLLTGVTLGVYLATLPFLADASHWVFGLLLLAQLFDSFADFFNVGFRATDRFSEEAKWATVISVMQFFLLAGALCFSPSVLLAATAFALSRLLALAVLLATQRRYFQGLRPSPLAQAVRCMRTTRAYAVDFGLQSLFGQVDSIALNHFVGPAAVGIYQAGMRLFSGGAQTANVLANVFLPKAAAVAHDLALFAGEARRVQWAFIGAGAAFGLALAVGAHLWVVVFFGAAYQPLAQVLPWLGLLFFVRFFAAAWGIVLTTSGAQAFRATANLLQWLLVAACCVWMVPAFGTVGWVMALATGNSFLACAYLLRCRRLVALDRAQLLTVAMCLGVFAYVVPAPVLSSRLS